jgi:hypothetical protein
MEIMNEDLNSYNHKRFNDKMLLHVIEQLPCTSEKIFTTVLDMVMTQRMSIAGKSILSKFLLDKFKDQLEGVENKEEVMSKVTLYTDIYFA